MRKMRTAEEMLAYYCENRGPKEKRGLFEPVYALHDDLENYKEIESWLELDEYALVLFWGYIYIYIAAPHETQWIYILTNKRLIAKCMNKHGCQVIDNRKLKNIMVVPKRNEIFFDTDNWYRGLSDVIIDPKDREFIKRELAEVMPYIREIQEKEAQKKKFSGSPAEEIRRFKELCDDGIITEEEFEDRKRELLKFKYVD
ncbi:SHOCT domain-containing protein [Ihubacter sp. mB4P-1]|uniref:SHOCT domain-containing protein n=1 Tax=Ihubacter sp. mB4P-1 TaxID=3242370 RepID=UPI003C7DAC3D